MGCREANDRIRMRAMPIARGETVHPVHQHMDMSGGIAAAKAMYHRFYRR